MWYGSQASMTLRIGTRGSALALAQARNVAARLREAHGLDESDVEIVVITTSGDRVRDRPLADVGGKGLFAKELEEALFDGRVDLAVHSAKDLPTFLPDGLTLAVVPEREDARDALVTRGDTLETLRHGARIGTASVRRGALLLRARPDLELELLRGNVPTRLARVQNGEFDATLLAVAGLKRLGLDVHVSQALDPMIFPPAAGQGAIAIETREGDGRVRDALAPIDELDAHAALDCERAFLAVLDGSCRTPISGYARVERGRIAFSGAAFLPDGSESFDAVGEGAIGEAEAIGRAAGEDLRSRAPQSFLDAIGSGA